MRIITGTVKGLKLKTPRGLATRPTADRVKESLFNILNGLIDFDGKHVLDLFAGSGALGLESISRGAAAAIFVDNASTDFIRDNATHARFDNVEIIRSDAFKAIDRLSDQQRQFDLIFVDPPYHLGLSQRTIDRIIDRNLIAAKGLVIIEIGVDETIKLIDQSSVERIRRVDYGHTTAIEFFRRIQQ